eukprot:1141594-Pleurochrysis_carterae.AAC.6
MYEGVWAGQQGRSASVMRRGFGALRRRCVATPGASADAALSTDDQGPRRVPRRRRCARTSGACVRSLEGHEAPARRACSLKVSSCFVSSPLMRLRTVRRDAHCTPSTSPPSNSFNGVQTSLALPVP